MEGQRHGFSCFQKIPYDLGLLDGKATKTYQSDSVFELTS